MQVRNEVKELRLLFEVLQILDSASDLSDNLETVLEVMAEHTGMMRGVITLLDEAHGEIAIEAAYGMSAEAQSATSSERASPARSSKAASRWSSPTCSWSRCS